MGGVPFLLVGLQTDRRNDRDTMDGLRENNQKPVTEKEVRVESLTYVLIFNFLNQFYKHVFQYVWWL